MTADPNLFTLGLNADGTSATSLDFLNGVYAAGGQITNSLTSAPGVTYTGSVSGTGGANRTAVDAAGDVLTFANNIPRITKLGLLVELASANIFPRSESHTSWFTSGASFTGTTLSPDNVTTAFGVALSAGGTSHYAGSPVITFASSTQYTLSYFVKAGSGTQFIQICLGSSPLFPGNYYANFDIINGLVTATSAGVTATITPAANGFYRITATATVQTGSGVNTYLFYVPSGTSGFQATYSAAGTEVFYVWGAQAETTAAVTSLIPTTSATVTRSNDGLSITFTGTPKKAVVSYGTSSTSTINSPTSPLNLGASSGGAWVGSYVTKVVIQ
jgi:hypothetical protein